MIVSVHCAATAQCRHSVVVIQLSSGCKLLFVLHNEFRLSFHRAD